MDHVTGSGDIPALSTFFTMCSDIFIELLYNNFFCDKMFATVAVFNENDWQRKTFMKDLFFHLKDIDLLILKTHWLDHTGDDISRFPALKMRLSLNISVTSSWKF